MLVTHGKHRLLERAPLHFGQESGQFLLSSQKSPRAFVEQGCAVRCRLSRREPSRTTRPEFVRPAGRFPGSDYTVRVNEFVAVAPARVKWNR